MSPGPLEVWKEACPHCERFTTVSKSNQSLILVNPRVCENCGELFYFVVLEPEFSNIVMKITEYETWYKEWLNGKESTTDA